MEGVELNPDRLVFVVAMPKELPPLTEHLEGATETKVCGRQILEGRLNGRPAAVVVSGVGKVNAAAATQLAILRYAPRRILNYGVAGGLLHDMEVGGIYPVARSVEYDVDLSEINGTAKGVLEGYSTPYLPFSVAEKDRSRAVTLATGDRFTNAAAEHAFLGRFSAGLRDMEGAAIAHVCKVAGVECRAWKCVSDVAGKSEMTRQYWKNIAFCLAELTRALPTFEF